MAIPIRFKQTPVLLKCFKENSPTACPTCSYFRLILYYLDSLSSSYGDKLKEYLLSDYNDTL